MLRRLRVSYRQKILRKQPRLVQGVQIDSEEWKQRARRSQMVRRANEQIAAMSID
jgi:hypothetical protein